MHNGQDIQLSDREGFHEHNIVRGLGGVRENCGDGSSNLRDGTSGEWRRSVIDQSRFFVRQIKPKETSNEAVQSSNHQLLRWTRVGQKLTQSKNGPVMIAVQVIASSLNFRYSKYALLASKKGTASITALF